MFLFIFITIQIHRYLHVHKHIHTIQIHRSFTCHIGGGHCPMDQVPEVVNNEVNRFIRERIVGRGSEIYN